MKYSRPLQDTTDAPPARAHHTAVAVDNQVQPPPPRIPSGVLHATLTRG